jgi:membrane-bound metal-dependent hydrolase YbcI (DUF457 family)
VLARAGLNRKSALATATLVLAAEAPDLDIFTELGGRVFGFEHHRGITHTLLGAPLISALVVGFLWLYWRWLGHRRKKGWQPPPRWGLLFGFGCLAAASHILLDFTNNYGVRPFAPFSYRWFSWDIVFIVEPVLWLILIGGLVLPSLAGLVTEEVRSSRVRGPRGRAASDPPLHGRQRANPGLQVQPAKEPHETDEVPAGTGASGEVELVRLGLMPVPRNRERYGANADGLEPDKLALPEGAGVGVIGEFDGLHGGAGWLRSGGERDDGE